MQKNKHKIKNPSKDILKKTRREMGEMSFEEIGLVLNMQAYKVERLFKKAMNKLSHPKMARALYDYDKLGDRPQISGD